MNCKLLISQDALFLKLNKSIKYSTKISLINHNIKLKALEGEFHECRNVFDCSSTEVNNLFQNNVIFHDFNVLHSYICIVSSTHYELLKNYKSKDVVIVLNRIKTGLSI